MSDLDFVTVCVPHRGDIVNFCQKLTKKRDDAADLVQDVYLRAFRAWSGFTPVGDPSACARSWLYRIAMNVFVENYRSTTRKRQRNHDYEEEIIASLYDLDRGDNPKLEGLSDEVTRALSTLTPDYREVIERIDLGGERYIAVAESLGVPIGTIMSRCHRARKQLRGALAKYAHDEYRIGDQADHVNDYSFGAGYSQSTR